jgi:uncharacterized protein (DUF849 family)
MLQVCLNGVRNRTECAHLPVTAEELAAAALEAVRAGAEDIHLHPKDAAGEDTMEPFHVAAVLAAVRAAVPGIPVGVTTGAWTARDAQQRVEAVRSWTVLPDHASVNWHEDGASEVAGALLARGVGVEAGIFSGTRAVRRFLAWPQAHRVIRVLAEITDTDPQTAPQAADSLLAGLGAEADVPILLHSEGAAAWTILTMAASLRLDVRIGLEDVLVLPDGTLAESNADLIRAARQVMSRATA